MTFGGFGFLLSKVLEGNYDLGEQKGPLQGLRQELPCLGDDGSRFRSFL